MCRKDRVKNVADKDVLRKKIYILYFRSPFLGTATTEMLAPLLSLLFFLSLSLSFSVIFYLRLSVDGLRAISVFVGETRGPNSPTCPRECMQCSCVFTLPSHSPVPSPTLLGPPPVGPLSRCSVHKWIHHPCVSCGTFLNRTHSDPL